MADFAMTLNGSAFAVPPEGRFSITSPQNGIATLQTQLWDYALGALPTFDDEIVVTRDGTPIFGGSIVTPKIGGVGGSPSSDVIGSLTVHDFNKLASRRYLTAQSVAAGTMKAALLLAVPYMPGVSLDVGQVDGPTIEAFEITATWKPVDLLDYLTSVTGYLWRVSPVKVLKAIAPGSVAAPFNVTETDDVPIGDLTVTPKRDEYANKVIVLGTGFTGIASDTGAITAHGEWELLAQAPDLITQDAVDALATSILAAKLPTLKEVEYVTLEHGLEPGMTQTIEKSIRGIDNTFLITQVNLDYSGGLARYKVTAIEGLVYQTGWREKTRQLFSGSGGSALVLPGSPGGGGGGATPIRYFYFLGGSGVDYVQSPTPTWIAASPMKVTVNTIPRATTAAQITAQFNALTAGVSVQGRIFDVTLGTPCSGISAVVTPNGIWTTVTWVVTLTAGSHEYQLQLLPGTANEDVAAMGYLE